MLSIPSTNLFSVNMYEKYASEDDDDKIKLQYTSAPVDDNEKFEI